MGHSLTHSLTHSPIWSVSELSVTVELLKGLWLAGLCCLCLLLEQYGHTMFPFYVFKLMNKLKQKKKLVMSRTVLAARHRSCDRMVNPIRPTDEYHVRTKPIPTALRWSGLIWSGVSECVLSALHTLTFAYPW